QMVLANFGSRQEYSERLINDIHARSEQQHPVVAVVGLGSSYEGTEKTAQKLADLGIPMVSAVASAAILNSHTYQGLYSVSPSSSDYVRALRDLLDKRLAGLTFGAGSGIVVADDNENDFYVQGLRRAFLGNLGYYLGNREPQVFTGGTIEADAPPNV